MLSRITEHCSELLDVSVCTDLFTTTELGPSNNTPSEMANKFGIPYLGKIPIDTNVMKACEDGYGLLDVYPESVAAGPFGKIVELVMQATYSPAEAEAAALTSEESASA